MARATGGGRSGWTDLRRPMRGEVAAEWLRFVLFLSLLSSSSTELWVGLKSGAGGVVYIAKIYNPTAKAKGGSWFKQKQADENGEARCCFCLT